MYAQELQGIYSNDLRVNLLTAMLPLQQAERELEEGKVGSRQLPLGEAKKSAKNRGRIDVVAEIVRCCERATSKSRIMMVTNINSIVATKMISQLVQTGLLESVHENNTVHYLATTRGVEFVRKYWELVSMLSRELIPSKAGNANRLESLIF